MTDAESRHDCNILLYKLYEQKCAFPKIYKLAAVVATFGCSVAVCECSFSAFSRIDTPDRRSMTHGRQRNLVLLAFEKSRTKKIDFDDFVLRFGRKRILYTSPKNTFQKLHFPEKHLAETTLSRTYISLNVHFPEITFS